ncbi:MAG: DUF1549 domain-containing protein, partial [Planctomycetota bacterium]
PTPAEREAYLTDQRSDAYERLVDRLLCSPHYGERWGRRWLDAARYSDSDGYEKDLRRSNWFYRDWVITAFNDDKPYDDFVIEQIAGDLLPGAGQDQRVATGFLRNSMVNEEGGADPEQFRVEGVFDRMDAIGKAILGLTTQCAQCHTHKYDPLTHEEYFGLYAFLNNCNESIIAAYTPEQQRQIARIGDRIAALEAELKNSHPSWREEAMSWAAARREADVDWRLMSVERENFTGQKFAFLADGAVVSQSYAPPKATNGFIAVSPPERVTAIRLELLNHADLPRGGPGRSIYGSNALTEFEVVGVDAQGKERRLEIASAVADLNVDRRPIGAPFVDDRNGPDQRVVGPIDLAIDGDPRTAWTTDSGPATRNQPRAAVFVLAEPLDASSIEQLIVRLKQNHGGMYGDQRHSNIAGCFRFSTTDAETPAVAPLPVAIREVMAQPVDDFTDAEWRTLFSFWRTTRPERSSVNAEIQRLLTDYPEGVNQYVVSERTGADRRVTHRLDRGDFLSPDQTVEPHTPRFLHPLRDEAPADRLALAKWLVDRRSPTTARAMVNRVWQAYFGTGLV